MPSLQATLFLLLVLLPLCNARHFKGTDEDSGDGDKLSLDMEEKREDEAKTEDLDSVKKDSESEGDSLVRRMLKSSHKRQDDMPGIWGRSIESKDSEDIHAQLVKLDESEENEERRDEGAEPQPPGLWGREFENNPPKPAEVWERGIENKQPPGLWGREIENSLPGPPGLWGRDAENVPHGLWERHIVNKPFKPAEVWERGIENKQQPGLWGRGIENSLPRPPGPPGLWGRDAVNGPYGLWERHIVNKPPKPVWEREIENKQQPGLWGREVENRAPGPPGLWGREIEYQRPARVALMSRVEGWDDADDKDEVIHDDK